MPSDLIRARGVLASNLANVDGISRHLLNVRFSWTA